PATSIGAITGNDTRRRNASGTQAIKAAATLITVIGLPADDSEASMISTTGTTSTGSQSIKTWELVTRLTTSPRIIRTGPMTLSPMVLVAMARRAAHQTVLAPWARTARAVRAAGACSAVTTSCGGRATPSATGPAATGR